MVWIQVWDKPDPWLILAIFRCNVCINVRLSLLTSVYTAFYIHSKNSYTISTLTTRLKKYQWIMNKKNQTLTLRTKISTGAGANSIPQYPYWKWYQTVPLYTHVLIFFLFQKNVLINSTYPFYSILIHNTYI